MTKVTRSRTLRASSGASTKRRCSTNRYEPGPLFGSLSELPIPIRSGAMQRPSGCKCGMTLRQRYDEVGLPCSSTMRSPSPTSTYAISLPRTCRRCFWYGNAAEIMFASPVVFAAADVDLEVGSLAPGQLLPALWMLRRGIREHAHAPHRIKQQFRTPSQFRQSEPSPTPPRTSLGRWREEHLRRSLLPRLHREEQESLKTQQTLSGQLH